MSTASRPALLALSVLFGIALAASSLAQVNASGEILTPVDQGVADLDGLNTSNRLIPIDLREENDFAGLYESPELGGRLIRRSGAITAVFPRSEYAASEGFIFPVIPAGTEFFIGPMTITDPAYTPPGADPATSAVDSRLDLASTGMTSGIIDNLNPPPIRRIHATPRHGVTLEELLTGQVGAGPEGAEPTPSVWSNEQYRRGRIAALLEQALRRHRGT
ncbi:MAG: hypothetical protein H6813_02265 [Phycisphaeraceae bacterium]|nr:hypothetical protein [Phycisphaeraceae bacterium]MCB9848858.1 hypothetical protein [Phycisphaeraceae bacterium]